MKFFNTAGPVRPDEHYFVPHRLDLTEVFDLIERKQYFVLHAPRQSGKTTAIKQIASRQRPRHSQYLSYFSWVYRLLQQT